MHGNELRLFMSQSILPFSNYLCRAPDIAALGTICNVSGMAQCGPNIQLEELYIHLPFTYDLLVIVILG